MSANRLVDIMNRPLGDNPVCGKSLLFTAGAAALRAAIRPVDFGESGPILVALESRAAASYISEQGDITVILHTTAARNMRIRANETFYLVTTGDDDGYAQYERVDAVDAILVATVVGRRA